MAKALGTQVLKSLLPWRPAHACSKVKCLVNARYMHSAQPPYTDLEDRLLIAGHSSCNVTSLLLNKNEIAGPGVGERERERERERVSNYSL